MGMAWRSRDSKPSAPTDAWSFYESLGVQRRSMLTVVQREVVAICDLRQEVNSGGFEVYFRYGGGNTAQDAVGALPAVLGQEWADLLSAAMSLLGPDYPLDIDTREKRLDAPGVEEALNSLNARYYGLEEATDADALVSSHLTSAT